MKPITIRFTGTFTFEEAPEELGSIDNCLVQELTQEPDELDDYFDKFGLSWEVVTDDDARTTTDTLVMREWLLSGFDVRAVRWDGTTRCLRAGDGVDDEDSLRGYTFRKVRA